MVALRYPLKFLLFYHVDPRRFFASADNIKKNFCFYKEFKYKNGGKVLFEKINPSYMGENANKVESSDFRYQISEKELEKEFISEANEDGLFWGVKLYVALGYPPYIGINDYSKKFSLC